MVRCSRLRRCYQSKGASMNQERLDTLAEAFRSQGLTWSQTNFAISVVRNEVGSEREACARACDALWSAAECAAVIRARGQA